MSNIEIREEKELRVSSSIKMEIYATQSFCLFLVSDTENSGLTFIILFGETLVQTPTYSIRFYCFIFMQFKNE